MKFTRSDASFAMMCVLFAAIIFFPQHIMTVMNVLGLLLSAILVWSGYVELSTSLRLPELSTLKNYAVGGLALIGGVAAFVHFGWRLV